MILNKKKDPNPNFNSAWNFGLRNLVEQLEFFSQNRFNNLNFPGWNNKSRDRWIFFSGKTRVVTLRWFHGPGAICVCLFAPRLERWFGDFFVAGLVRLELVDGNKPPGWGWWWLKSTMILEGCIHHPKGGFLAWCLNHQPGGTPPKGYKWAENPWGFHWGQINPTKKGGPNFNLFISG